MSHKPEILFDEMSGTEGNLGIITLNRPEVLNALNHTMFTLLDQKLSEWQTAPQIKAVVIQAGPGRAFCAGGDIRYAYERGIARDPNLAHFFGDEYRLNQRIYHYPKPYIALLDGITMGGGAGISIHGSHRIATERLQFAMPETGIGFYPDVGATYFLPRLPGKIGYYLGLTGAKIAYNDCLAIGLADFLVPSDCFSELYLALAETVFAEQAKQRVTEIIKHFSKPVPHSMLFDHKAAIDTCFAKNTVEEIFSALKNHPDPWCKEQYDILQTKSPTSLKVTLQQMQLGEKLTFDECMQLEFHLTSQFIQGNDFFEGVRAVIIDKDQKPCWNPSQLNEVSAADIKKYFHPAVIS